MEVRLVNNYNATNKINLQSKGVNVPNLQPLRCDTVSFGALKKTQFEGLDFAAVEKFKAPIEQFNSNEDLQNWCKNKIKTDYANKDLSGRQDETKIQRKAMMKEWTDYVLKDGDGYNDAAKLLILNAITKDLKPNNDKLPPVLNKGILADCMDEINTSLKADKKYSFDLNKMYQLKLNNFYVEDTNTGETGSKWVVIPSKKNDPKNFTDNVDKLKVLSHANWCTKSFKAEPYLADGDFHVYLEDGKPKVGIRFVGDKIQEIQGEINNCIVPFDYDEMIYNYIDENKFKLSLEAKNEIEVSKTQKENIENIKKDLGEAIETNDAEKIFDYFGLNPKVDEDGLITISEYKTSFDKINFADLGINENKLFEKIKRIESDVKIDKNSKLTSLGNVEYIDGDLQIAYSNLLSLGKLETVMGSVYCNEKLKSLGNLKYVKNSLVTRSDNLNFDNIEFVEGINIKELRNEAAKKELNPERIFELSGIKTYSDKDGYLTLSGYDQPTMLLSFKDLNINEDKLFERVKKIDGDITLKGSNLTSLENLESIDGNAVFCSNKLKSFGKLTSIRGDAYFNNVAGSLDELKAIGGDAYFGYSEIAEIPKLEYIGGSANFVHTKGKSLGSLKHIGKDAIFSNSEISDLGNLETIGRNASFKYATLKSLGNLETIDGNVNFDYSKITDLGKLKYVGGDIYSKFSNISHDDIKKINRPHNNLYYMFKSVLKKYPMDNAV